MKIRNLSMVTTKFVATGMMKIRNFLGEVIHIIERKWTFGRELLELLGFYSIPEKFSGGFHLNILGEIINPPITTRWDNRVNAKGYIFSTYKMELRHTTFFQLKSD